MENQSQPKVRPAFLLVICILSFIGLGYSILSALFSLAIGRDTESFYSMYQSMIEKSMNDMGSMPASTAAFLEKIMNSVLVYVEHMNTLNLISLVGSTIALAGVIMMFNLKKSGFYLYTAAKIFMLLFPVLLIGFNFLSLLILLFGTIFTGAFIAMYAVNLKSMD